MQIAQLMKVPELLSMPGHAALQSNNANGTGDPKLPPEVAHFSIAIANNGDIRRLNKMH